MKLPPCHSRREIEPGGQLFFCAHPRVQVPGGLVRAEICRICSFWKEPPPREFRAYPPLDPPQPPLPRASCRYLGAQIGTRDCVTCRGQVRLKVFACHHPQHGETTLMECGTCQDYQAAPQMEEDPTHVFGSKVTNWSVGVTTAPREQPTLERCLGSLLAAGWEAARIFAEPGVKIPGQFAHLPVSRRDTTLGAWPNWFLGLSELVLRHPQADAYLMVQDDAVFCRNVRGLMEQILWPSGEVATVSVYCPQTYAQRIDGLHRVEPGWGLIGAVANVFPNASVRSLLSHGPTLDHRRTGPDQGLRHIDSVIGRWTAEADLSVYYHSPSLVQHIGNTSTVWSTAVNWGHRHSGNFVGEEFDALSILPNLGTR